MTQGTKKFKEFIEDLNPELTTYVVGYRPVDDEEVKVPLSLIGLSGDSSGKFIRKDTDDEAHGTISFNNNINIRNNIRSQQYIQNARGWFGDGKGNFEMNSLRLREFLETPELRKNRITVMQNEFWFTDSATVLDAVLRNDGNYDVTFKLEEGEFVPFRAGDILKGIYNYDTGFYTVYLHVESLIYAEGSGAKAVVASSMNGRVPAKAMLLARMNNVADPDRQGSMFADGLHGYIRILQGFDPKEPTAQGTFNTLKVQLGNLAGIQGHPAFGDLKGSGLYAENVYLVGHIVQTDWKGEETQPLLYFKGLYSSVATYYPYDSVRYVDPVTAKEAIYYVKLQQNTVPGITGIPPTDGDYWELNQTVESGINGNSIWTTYHDSREEPARPTTPQGLDNGWHMNLTTKTVWMCQKIASTIELGKWSEPVKIAAIDGTNGDYVSYAFKLSDTIPSTPESGLPENQGPIPEGWVDAPGSVGKWWMTMGTIDGNTNKIIGVWSSPVQVNGDKGDPGADGSYTVYQFAKFKGMNIPDDDKAQWLSNPPSLLEGEFLFMRMNTIFPPATEPSPETWSASVRISGEKGEKGFDGIDGDFSEFVYTRTSSDAVEPEESPNAEYPQDGSSPQGKVNEVGYVPPGWTADPISISEWFKCEWVSKRYKVGNTWGRFSDPAVWTRYGIDGVDGKSNEYIYFQHTSSEGVPYPNDATNAGKEDDGWVPDVGIGSGVDRVAWTDNPSGVSIQYPYEFVSKRTKVDGKWGPFSWPAAVWAKFGVNGQDGNGIEFIFKRTTNSNSPARPTSSPQQDDYIPVSEGWTDNASGTNQSYPYEWMCKRKKLNNLWGAWTQPVVWSTWIKGSDGIPGAPGAPGAPGPAGAGTVLEFYGNYDNNKGYCWYNNNRPVVYYSGQYWALAPKYENTCNTKGWSSSEWVVLNSSATLATGLFLAETATIAGWKFSTNYIWSQDSRVLLNGFNADIPLAIGQNAVTSPGSATFRVTKEGVLFATGATISGTINAISGTFKKLTMEDITIKNLTCESGVIGGFSINETTLGNRATSENGSNGVLIGRTVIQFKESAKFLAVGSTATPYESGLVAMLYISNNVYESRINNHPIYVVKSNQSGDSFNLPFIGSSALPYIGNSYFVSAFNMQPGNRRFCVGSYWFLNATWNQRMYISADEWANSYDCGNPNDGKGLYWSPSRKIVYAQL